MTTDRPSAVWLITRREITSRVFSKAFLIGLGTTVVIIFGIFGIVSLIDQDDPVNLGVVGPTPAGAVENLELIGELQETEIDITMLASEADGELAIEEGEVDGFVIDDRLVMREADAELIALVTPAWQQATLVAELGDAGLNQSEIGQALTNAGQLEIVELEADPESEAKEAVAFLTVVLLFISIQVAGAYIMMGVFEEKSTKVVELVLSSVRARDLLIGKIIGIGLLGILQVAALAGSAIAAASIFGSSALPALSVSLIGTGLIWFVLGYMLYGSVFAAGASLAPRQEDAQATLAPVTVVLMLSYFGAIFSASDPNSVVARIISWIPLTAPFAMPGRIAAGDALWWEIIGSMALTAIVAFLVLGLAERIYVRSIIHTDRKLGWREAWTLQA